MAEERIVDDDIDRNKKYRIVKGEDGEDELIIETQEEEEEIEFDASQELVEDEELGTITAEQYDEVLRQRAEEEQTNKQVLADLIERAKNSLEQNKFADTLEYVESAENLELELCDGELSCIKLEALTRKFTDFSADESITEAAETVSEKADQSQRGALYEKYGESLNKKRAELFEKLEKVNAQYSAEQQSRREVLAPRKAKALKNFIITLAVFAVFLIAAIVCSTMMFSMQNGAMLIVTIVLAAIAFVAFVAFVFASRAFVGAARMSAANEKDFSTKLGRERAALNAYSLILEKVNTAIEPKENDIP